jgi:hypothetical protein
MTIPPGLPGAASGAVDCPADTDSTVGIGIIGFVDPGEDSRDLGGDGAHQVEELAVVQHRFDLLAFGHVGELRLGEAGVHQDRAQAEFAGRQHAQHHAAVVTGQDRDHIAGPQSAFGEAAGEGVRAVVEFAEGEFPRLVDDGGGVGAGLHGVHDHTGERAVLGRVAHRPDGVVEPQRIEEAAFAHHVHGQGDIAGSANGAGQRQCHRRQPSAVYRRERRLPPRTPVHRPP